MTMKTRRENYIPRLVDKLTTTKLKIPTGRRPTSSLITTEYDRGVEPGPMVKKLQLVVRTGLGNLDLRISSHTGSSSVFGNTQVSLNHWALVEDDYIVQVNVRQGVYVDAIQFVTAKGNVSPFYGGRGGNYKRFRAESGCEVLGVLLCRTEHADPLVP